MDTFLRQGNVLINRLTDIDESQQTQLGLKKVS